MSLLFCQGSREMFSSIKWKFVVIYFVLIFIAMIISGVFIVGKLEKEQINNIKNEMELTVEAILSSSSYLSEEHWLEHRAEIQARLSEWRIGANESVYALDMEEVPKIVATSAKGLTQVVDIYSSKIIHPMLVEQARKGKAFEIVSDEQGKSHQHLAYPVFSNSGELRGMIYMVADLDKVYQSMNESQRIIFRAILIALFITVILGFLIANGITEPIRDVTKKAELMARGDFNQQVEVKSEDEIGQLAMMFNALTKKLNMTISEMNLEKSKLNAIFEYMTEGVVAIDIQGNIIRMNPIAARLLGYSSSEEGRGHRFPRALLDVDEISFSEEESAEEKLITITGMVYKVKYALFKDDNLQIGGLIVVFQDMTKEHKLDEIRKEFVANVSHELKTPLTTIKTYTETLMESDVDMATARNFLAVIDKESDRMTRLVRDLLDLSNMDYGKSVWKSDEVSLSELLSEVLEQLNYSIQEKGHVLHTSIEVLPTMILDRDAVERVLLNVLSNSIKYTENGGTLNVSLRREDGVAVIRVKDNGIGIGEGELERVFERFYRVEKGRSREMGGTGLGLAIAKEIVEGHGGTIRMDSKLGAGTETTIRLPFRERGE